MFLDLLLALVLTRVWPNAVLSARAKFAREYVVKQFWLSFVEDKFDLDSAIQTKAEFSCAIAVMDRIGGLEEEERRTRKLVWAKICSYTQAVVCNGQNHMQNYRILKLRSVKEAVNWVYDDALDEHVWLSELTISLQEAKVLEALQCDSKFLCIVQWRMLWFSAPTSLNNELLNDGVILEKYNEAVSMAFHSVFTLLYWRMNTPRS